MVNEKARMNRHTIARGQGEKEEIGVRQFGRGSSESFEGVGVWREREL